MYVSLFPSGMMSTNIKHVKYKYKYMKTYYIKHKFTNYKWIKVF